MNEELKSALDEMELLLTLSLTPQQLARLAIGYFAIVESLSVGRDSVDGVLQFHNTVKDRLTGGQSGQG